MSYTRHTWNAGEGGGTPITAAKLNEMEAGIEAAARPRMSETASVVRTDTVRAVNASTQWPTMVTSMTPDHVLSLRIMNLSSAERLFVGYGTYNNPNHTTEPHEVPPGSEILLGAVDKPVFARYETTTQDVRIIQETGV